jgi:uncharacterized membrane protein
MTDDTDPTHNSRLAWAGAVIGFALGGFFDGILLHQVLQWHHLFSLVPGEMWRDIRNQILMDGWFHVLHYVIALVGLWLLWTARAGFAGSGSDRRLLGATLLGFSAWQFVDVVLFHWILMIHRIRVDVPSPLAYDLSWLVAFGVTTLCAGLWLWLWRGRGGTGGTGRPAAVGLAAIALLAGPVAAIPPQSAATLVLFRAGADPAEVFAAVAALDSRVLWASPSGDLMAITPAPHSGAWRQAWQLYSHGALMVGSTPALGGCLAWTQS